VATLVRFCRTLGFKGFSDFKLAFSIDLAKTQEGRDDTVLETQILPSDDSQTIAHKLQSAINAVMDETINLLDFHQLEVVVEAIRSANPVRGRSNDLRVQAAGTIPVSLCVKSVTRRHPPGARRGKDECGGCGAARAEDEPSSPTLRNGPLSGPDTGRTS